MPTSIARLGVAVCVCLVLAQLAHARPTADAVAQAKRHLAADRPGDAVKLLEAGLADADGDAAFLATLRQAYTAELAALSATNPAEAANVRTKLHLLGGAKPAAGDELKQAAALFKRGSSPAQLADAARFFAAAYQKVELTGEQRAAWAFCRLRVAHDRVGRGNLTAAERQTLSAEIADALKLAPQNAALQELGRGVLATLGGPAPVATSDVVETANFRVRHGGQVESGNAVAQAAEAARAALFARWASGPVAAWGVKCEVVLHATEASFTQATRQPAGATGDAAVTLAEGRITARRLDLRLDDATLTGDALPRELMNVVLADLFPLRAPPAWAALGMAVAATSPTEQDRYRRTAERCGRGEGLIPLPVLFAAKATPADRVTEFHVGSVSVVAYLVGLKGEREFVTFLGLIDRYGLGPAVQRVYGLDGVAGLEAAWGRELLGAK